MTHSLDDGGFADARGARAVVRRMMIRAALAEVGASTEALLNLLQKSCQTGSSERPAAGEQAVGLTAGDQAGGGSGIGIGVCETNAMRERKLLESVDLFLDLLDHIETAIGHGLFSAVGDPEGIGERQGGHSLCRPAKKTPPADGAGGEA